MELSEEQKIIGERKLLIKEQLIFWIKRYMAIFVPINAFHSVNDWNISLSRILFGGSPSVYLEGLNGGMQLIY